MHADTGQVTWRLAGLLCPFRALACPEGQEWRRLAWYLSPPDGSVTDYAVSPF
ncbi:hypothetical protein [Streptomyces chattanoogensis]|uniref:hypothetical protein n=1 Tax=Streptomyces chattanoogensis TaxID=66876 RepID=UPI0005D828BF|nr:hypothetical protein T261_1304 [Streptomyces lydicus]